jgi:hypothetical protein
MGSVRARNASMTPMTEHERQAFTKLCARISEEKNCEVFTQLLIELEALLERLNNHEAKRSGFEGENMST